MRDNVLHPSPRLPKHCLLTDRTQSRRDAVLPVSHRAISVLLGRHPVGVRALNRMELQLPMNGGCSSSSSSSCCCSRLRQCFPQRAVTRSSFIALLTMTTTTTLIRGSGNAVWFQRQTPEAPVAQHPQRRTGRAPTRRHRQAGFGN
jgi:hypothetical protein